MNKYPKKLEKGPPGSSWARRVGHGMVASREIEEMVTDAISNLGIESNAAAVAIDDDDDIATQEFDPGETTVSKAAIGRRRRRTRTRSSVEATKQLVKPSFEEHPGKPISTIDELKELQRRMLHSRPSQYNVFIWINEVQTTEIDKLTGRCMTEHVRIFWWMGEHPRYPTEMFACLRHDDIKYPYMNRPVEDSNEESLFLKAFYNLKSGINYIVNTLGEEKYITNRQTEPVVFSSETLVHDTKSREVDYIKYILADNRNANMYRIRTTFCRTAMNPVEHRYSRVNLFFPFLVTNFHYDKQNYVIIPEFRRIWRGSVQDEERSKKIKEEDTLTKMKEHHLHVYSIKDRM